MITGKLYNWLKWLAQVVLPALGTLYFTLDMIWGLGAGTEVVGTVMAIDLFLGVVLGVSQVNYSKTIEDGGDMVVQEDGRTIIQLDTEKATVQNLHTKKELRLKIKKTSSD